MKAFSALSALSIVLSVASCLASPPDSDGELVKQMSQHIPPIFKDNGRPSCDAIEEMLLPHRDRWVEDESTAIENWNRMIGLTADTWNDWSVPNPFLSIEIPHRWGMFSIGKEVIKRASFTDKPIQTLTLVQNPPFFVDGAHNKTSFYLNFLNVASSFNPETGFCSYSCLGRLCGKELLLIEKQTDVIMGKELVGTVRQMMLISKDPKDHNQIDISLLSSLESVHPAVNTVGIDPRSLEITPKFKRNSIKSSDL